MHLDCFAMKRDELKCSSDAKKLDGFKDLPEDTQKFIKEQLPAAVWVYLLSNVKMILLVCSMSL